MNYSILLISLASTAIFFFTFFFVSELVYAEGTHNSKPTFGTDHKTGLLVVNDGLTINGVPFDVYDNYKVKLEIPHLVTSEAQNFTSKVYASDELHIMEFLFGISEVGKWNEAEASVTFEFNFTGELQKVYANNLEDDIIDFESLKFATDKVYCTSGDAYKLCDQISVELSFNEVPIGKILAMQAIDHNQRSNIVYFDVSSTIDLNEKSFNSWNVFLSPYDGVLKNELFSPLKLPISFGDTVTWVNQDSNYHKILSGFAAHPEYSGEFFSTKILSPGDSFSETFDSETQFTGYVYYCQIHPWYTGELFFEDRDNIVHSTLDISYDVIDSESLQIVGLVESDLGNTEYEIQIYDSKNDLVFHKISSFEHDASFDISIDISSSIWTHDENYLLKLVYGVASESTELLLHIPFDNFNSELKLNALDFCENFKSDFVYLDTILPYWFSQSLCWYSNGLVVEKEISDSIEFFQKLA